MHALEGEEGIGVLGGADKGGLIDDFEGRSFD